MTVYADVLFFVNVMFDCLILALLARCMTVRIRAVRLIGASAAGAAGTAAVFCIDVSAVLSLALRLLIAAVMIVCAFGLRRRSIVYFLIFILLTEILSGTVILIISAVSGNVNSVIKNGIVYFDISGAAFFFSLLISYPAAFFMFGLLKERRRKRLYEIKIEYNGKTAAVTALYDSGNLLKEPVTGKSVIVAEWDAVKDILGGDLSGLEGIWFIPYRAVNGENGSVPAFLADNVTISGKETGRIFIGMTKNELSRTNEYRALIGAGIL